MQYMLVLDLKLHIEWFNNLSMIFFPGLEAG